MKGLLVKSKHFGINNPLHSQFALFLTERKRTVKYKNSHHQDQITSRVIQGNVLDLLLFLMYINDMYKFVTFKRPNLCADDLKIKHSFKLYVIAYSKFKVT